MIVGDLIRQLQRFDPSWEVVIVHPSSGEQHEIGSTWRTNDDDASVVEIAIDE